MTPSELSARLRALQAATTTFPAVLERTTAAAVVRAAPPALGVSARLTRTPTGVRVDFSGRGARAASRRLRSAAGNADALRASVRAAWR